MNTISVKVNSRGTVTLPKPFREALGVGDGGTLMLSFRDGAGVLKPPMEYPPIEMYTDERIAEFDAANSEFGHEIDEFLDKKGWVYDPETRMVCEKDDAPYMKNKKKA